MVGYYDAKPSCYRDASGQPAGIFVDAMRLIAARRGWTLEWRFEAWADLLSGLRSSSLDLVPAIVRTQEREAFAVFTEESLMTDWGAVYAQRGSGLRSVLDLAGRNVGALQDDYWFAGKGSLRDLLAGFKVEAKLQYFADYPSLFAALAEGRIEAAAASNSLGIIWEPQLPVESTPIIYNPIELRFAAPRTGVGSALVREVDLAIHDLRRDSPGAFRDLLGKYQVPVRKEYETPSYVLYILAALALVSLVFAVLFGVELRALRASSIVTSRALSRLQEARGELEASLRSKDLLVHELAHRVQNNLQLILSLVGLIQSDRGEGEASCGYEDLREKVFALSMIEAELETHPFADSGSLRTFLSFVIMRLRSVHSLSPDAITMSVELDGRGLSPEAAAPFAIIVNELLSNACLYGRGPDGSLKAQVSVRAFPDGSGELLVSDDGPGLPPGLDPRKAASLGFSLVKALAAQLSGDFSPVGGRGARFRVTMGHQAFVALPPFRPA